VLPVAELQRAFRTIVEDELEHEAPDSGVDRLEGGAGPFSFWGRCVGARRDAEDFRFPKKRELVCHAFRGLIVDSS
jgi:hypothetical protein